MVDTSIPEPKPTRTVRVIILEDQLYTAHGIQVMLESHQDIEVVYTTADHTKMLKLVADSRPDAAVVDLKLSGSINKGIHVLEQLREAHPDVRCIVLTSFPEVKHFLACMKAGAKAFVSKDADPQMRPTLPDLVHTVAKGGRYYDPELVEQMAALFPEGQPATDQPLHPTDAQLTSRELEVLELLIAKKTNQEIAEALVISPNTVKAHVSNLCTKLGADDRYEAALIGIARQLTSRPQPNADP